MMHKIVSWNVAGLRARLPLILKMLSEEKPDFLLLQETKTPNELMPVLAFQQADYHIIYTGQKGFNGVALLSRTPLTKTTCILPGTQETEPQARYIEAQINSHIFIASVYLPNGNPPLKKPDDTQRLAYKLDWIKALQNHIQIHLKQNHGLILGGDFNVIVSDQNVYNPELFRDNALMLPAVRKAFKAATHSLYDTIGQCCTDTPLYSFWDFQMGAWHRNLGMLLDTIFVSESFSKNVTGAGVLKTWRGLDKPSDHAPVWCTLNGL